MKNNKQLKEAWRMLTTTEKRLMLLVQQKLGLRIDVGQKDFLVALDKVSLIVNQLGRNRGNNRSTVVSALPDDTLEIKADVERRRVKFLDGGRRTIFKSYENAPWHAIHEYVRRMQMLIAHAAKTRQMKLKKELMSELSSSHEIRWLAVKRVCKSNRGKHTAGIDKIKSLNNKALAELAYNLVIDTKPSLIRRVDIPKPGTKKTRPLGIPTIYDRCIQYIICQVLEPAAEATYVDKNSYGFRPGRNCWDAIEQTRKIMGNGHHRWVLCADIKGCFDNIDHDYLMEKLDVPDDLKKQIYAYLKAGIVKGFPNSKGLKRLCYEDERAGNPPGLSFKRFVM